MSYKNRMTKPKRQYNLPYWVKNRKAEDFEWFEDWFGKTGHKAAYIKKSYSETIEVVTGKYIGWKEMGYKERSLKKRHRAYGRKMIAEQLLFMQEMEPCPYCGSEFCENHLSCKDEEEMLCAFEIEMYNYEMEVYTFHKDYWEDDYEYDYHINVDYW